MSKRGYEITVNGKKRTVVIHEISYDSVLAIAFEYPHPRAVYTMTYHHGHPSRPQGEMIRGDIVPIVDGMVFEAVIADNA